MMRRSTLFALAVVVPVAAIWIWLCARTAAYARTHDFLSFYTGAWLAAHGRFPALYDPAAQTAFQHSLLGRDGPLIPYIRPPFFALATAPLAWLSFDVAFGLWMALMTAAVAACWWWAGRRFGADGVVYAALFYPVAVSVGNTQDGALMMSLVAAAFLLAERGRDRAAGAVLALGLVKFHLALLWAPAMILARRWRMLGAYAAVGLAQAALSVALIGPAGLRQYAALLTRQDLATLSPAPEAMINVRGVSLNLAADSAVLTAALAVMTLGAWLAAVWRAPLWRWFAASATGSLLLAPHAYNYDLAALLAPLLVVLFGPARQATRLAAALVVFPFVIFLSYLGGAWQTAPALSLLGFLCALAAEPRNLTPAT
jgi:hypothetical protein